MKICPISGKYLQSTLKNGSREFSRYSFENLQKSHWTNTEMPGGRKEIDRYVVFSERKNESNERGFSIEKNFFFFEKDESSEYFPTYRYDEKRPTNGLPWKWFSVRVRLPFPPLPFFAQCYDEISLLPRTETVSKRLPIVHQWYYEQAVAETFQFARLLNERKTQIDVLNEERIILVFTKNFYIKDLSISRENNNFESRKFKMYT